MRQQCTKNIQRHYLPNIKNPFSPTLKGRVRHLTKYKFLMDKTNTKKPRTMLILSKRIGKKFTIAYKMRNPAQVARF